MTTQYNAAASKEWLEADGLGGFASGSATGIATRRYHALLLSATQPPTARMVLINAVEAWLDQYDAAGNVTHIALSTHRYVPDVLYPDGTERIVDFQVSPWPTWRFRVDESRASNGQTADQMIVTQEIFAAPDSGDIVLRWRLDASPVSLATSVMSSILRVRPLLSVRDYHGLHHRNDAFDFTAQGNAGRMTWRPYADRPAVSILSNGDYRQAPLWFEQFLYSEEVARGMDASEDLASPGEFSFDLHAGEALMILRAGSTRDVRVRERVQIAAEARMNRHIQIVDTALARAGQLVATTDTPDARQNNTTAQAQKATARTFARLSASAEHYFAQRGQGSTIIAGFPWFTDWGRDTFIALRGLTLCTGREAYAGAILGEWADTVSEGMLPNRFPDGGDTPEYNSVDASLWFIVAMHAYLQTDHAHASLRTKLQNAADAILEGYARGTRYGIGMREDGLIHAGENHDAHPTQLTWMDARVGLRPVTPRVGKPVEVQALWINALRIAAAWSPHWHALADRAQDSFIARFTDPVSGALFDVVDVDGVAGSIDRSIRPNQIFAVGGLPFTIVAEHTARAVLAQVERVLWTPLGLRTLSPADPRYVARYEGPPDDRDNAYHQGTVWLWLAGPFVQAWLNVHDGGSQDASFEARAEARRRFIAPLDAHLDEAGLGHLSEIADADAPHTPRGTPFQAWSLAERLRLEILL